MITLTGADEPEGGLRHNVLSAQQLSCSLLANLRKHLLYLFIIITYLICIIILNAHSLKRLKEFRKKFMNEWFYYILLKWQ